MAELTTTDLPEWERELLDATPPTDAGQRRVARCNGCGGEEPTRLWLLTDRRRWPFDNRPPRLCDQCWLRRVRGEIVRTWSGRQTVARVATTHPQHGVLDRGTIHATSASAGWRMVWRVTDHDGHDLGTVAGDYLAAEAALLDATGWADQIDQTDQTDETKE